MLLVLVELFLSAAEFRLELVSFLLAVLVAPVIAVVNRVTRCPVDDEVVGSASMGSVMSPDFLMLQVTLGSSAIRREFLF